MIEQLIKNTVRDIPNFPKEGIIFKDITTIFQDPQMCKDIVNAFVERLESLQIDAVVGVESRGFLLGPAIAMQLGVPFIPIRKAGKLPGACLKQSYDLEYGSATIEMHKDVIAPGKQVLVHDDLLATGGTVLAAANLLKQIDVEVAGFAFIIELSFLEGATKLKELNRPVISLATYS